MAATIPRGDTSPLAPRLDRLVDAALDSVVLGLGVWTLVYQGGLWIGATRVQVAVVAVMAGAGAIFWMRQGSRAPVPAREVVPERWVSRPLVGAALGLGIAATALLVAGRSAWFWAAAIASLAAAAAAMRGQEPREESARTGVIVVLVVAACAAALSATQRDWSRDNFYYVDRAFAIRDADGPLPLGRDTLHSDGLFPSVVPENDLGTLEGLVGVSAALFGGHPMSWYSFVVHPAFVFLGAIAIWRTARILGSPHPHLVAAFGLAALYLFRMEGGVSTRVFSARTGRTGITALLIPAVIAYTMELVRHPNARTAARAAAVGIAAGGFILSGVLVVPPVAAAAAVAVWRKGMKGRDFAWLGGVVAAVAGYYLTLAAAAVSLGRPLLASEEGGRAGRSVGEIWAHALGDNGPQVRPYVPLTLLLLSAWFVAPTRAIRRYSISAPLAALLLGFGPVTLWVARNTAAGSAIWRLGWTVPLGLLLGLAIASVWALHPRWLGVTATASLLAVLVGVAMPLTGTRLAAPVWDGNELVPSAVRLAALAPDGSLVAAPLGIAGFVAVVTNRVYPVQVYSGSIKFIARFGDPAWQPEERTEVMSWITDGTQGREPHRLARALDALGVSAICLRTAARSADMNRALRSAGFIEVGSDEFCEFWTRVES